MRAVFLETNSKIYTLHLLKFKIDTLQFVNK